MRTARMAWLAALLAVAPAAAPGADDDATYDKSWLQEKNWPKFLAPAQVKVGAKDSAEAKLLKERYEAAQHELRSRYVYWLQPTSTTLPEVWGAAERALGARLELEGKRADRLALLKEKVAFAKVVEKQAKGLYAKFQSARYDADVPAARYYRAGAELELLRAERAAKGEPAK